MRVEVLGDKELLAKLTKTHQRTRHNVTTALRDSGRRITLRARERAREHKDTGTMDRSIGFELTPDDDLLVYAEAPYAGYVEFGTRPHFPPIAPLLGWVARHGLPRGVAWAIQKAIGVRGTPPHPFLWPSVEEERGWLLARLQRILD